MGQALDTGEATVQHGWHRSPIGKFLLDGDNLRECEHSQKGGLRSCSGFWTIMSKLQALLGSRGIRARDPEHLGVCSLCPWTSFAMSPVTRQHFSNLLGHRTIFIFITQERHVSYKCEPYYMNSPVNFILKGRLLHNNHYVNRLYFSYIIHLQRKKIPLALFFCCWFCETIINIHLVE